MFEKRESKFKKEGEMNIIDLEEFKLQKNLIKAKKNVKKLQLGYLRDLQK